MKHLEIKDSGSWRKVVSFEPHQEDAVKKAGQALMEAIGHPKVTMRIAEKVDGQSVAVAHCDSPAWQWEQTRKV